MSAVAAVVAVVGSANLDIVAHAERAPVAGETVLGRELSIVEGGKGANQAMAAVGFAEAAFVGCVGDDDAGRRLLARLSGGGVRTDPVLTGALPSGHALITVSDDGENRIVVVPGANLELTPEHVVASLDALQPAVVLSQLEIPLESVTAAARWAREHGSAFLLNPSPMRELPPELVALVDVLLVNTGEARTMLAQQSAAGSLEAVDPAELAEALCSNERIVVVTAGAQGAALARPGVGTVHVAAEQVRIVDTTGAGDAFAGTLAGLLARGVDIEACVREATAVAGEVVATAREDRERRG